MRTSVPVRLLATIGLVTITACGRGGSNATPADTVAVEPAADTVAVEPEVDVAVPLPFFEIVGHHAGNAYDYVKQADWAAARASVDSLSTSMRDVEARDTAGRGTDIRQSLARLDSAVARRARAQGLREANHLTEIGARLASAHDTPVPATVTLLDYYGRELEIWAQAKNSGKLSQTASEIRRTWDDLRPRVISLGGTTQAARFDRVVARVSAARTPAQYVRVAKPLLDEVDTLEAVFTR